MQDRPPGEQVWRQLTLRLTLNDLTLTTIVPVWALLLELADWRVYLGLVVIRSVVAFRSLRALLDPYVRNAGNLDALGERELLEVDRALQFGPRRFVIQYILGWVLATLAAMGIGMLGWPSP